MVRAPRLLLFLVLPGGSAAAQTPDRWSFAASASGTLLVGDSDFLDGGFGLDLSVQRHLSRLAAVRADFVVINLDDQVVPGERADNQLLLLGGGPEISAELGPVSPYARGLVGFAVNREVREGSPLDERATAAAIIGGGIGLRIKVADSWRLDVGTDIVKLGNLEFARTNEAGPPLVDDPGALRLRVGVQWTPGAAVKGVPGEPRHEPDHDTMIRGSESHDLPEHPCGREIPEPPELNSNVQGENFPRGGSPAIRDEMPVLPQTHDRGDCHRVH